MSLGIGKRYFAEMIKVKFGSLEECITFMKDNPPENKYQFYEIRPIVHFEGQNVIVYEYGCSLLLGRKRK